MSFLNTEFCTFSVGSPHDHCGLIYFDVSKLSLINLEKLSTNNINPYIE